MGRATAKLAPAKPSSNPIASTSANPLTPSHPHSTAPMTQPNRNNPVFLAPNRSLARPTPTLRSAPPSRGQATSKPFSVEFNPNSCAIEIPSAPIKSQAMKLTSKCSQAPIKDGQWPLRSADRTVLMTPFRLLNRDRSFLSPESAELHYRRPTFDPASEAVSFSHEGWVCPWSSICYSHRVNMAKPDDKLDEASLERQILEPSHPALPEPPPLPPPAH